MTNHAEHDAAKQASEVAAFRAQFANPQTAQTGPPQPAASSAAASGGVTIVDARSPLHKKRRGAPNEGSTVAVSPSKSRGHLFSNLAIPERLAPGSAFYWTCAGRDCGRLGLAIANEDPDWQSSRLEFHQLFCSAFSDPISGEPLKCREGPVELIDRFHTTNLQTVKAYNLADRIGASIPFRSKVNISLCVLCTHVRFGGGRRSHDIPGAGIRFWNPVSNT